MEQKDSIRAYFDFVKERPELFTQSSHIPLVLDEERMRDFSRESGRPMGIVYHNRGFYRVVADLCKKKEWDGVFLCPCYLRAAYQWCRSPSVSGRPFWTSAQFPPQLPRRASGTAPGLCKEGADAGGKHPGGIV